MKAKRTVNLNTPLVDPLLSRWVLSLAYNRGWLSGNFCCDSSAWQVIHCHRPYRGRDKVGLFPWQTVAIFFHFLLIRIGLLPKPGCPHT